ncbi:HET-domain-containing protein, partial [Polyplosphaeria fusca]
MSDPFAAFPLATNSKCIRVFEVCPASSTAPEHDHQIYGELSVIDLNDNPLFSALSYVWGVHSTTPHFVHCGASRIKVTPNCFSALVNLRKKLINEPLVIWVDAICINQNDDAEKSHQIPLMGDIYSKATSTCIWLGEGTAGTDRAMQYLATAGAVAPVYTTTSDLAALLSREWIQRVWTYQEILLSSNAIV